MVWPLQIKYILYINTYQNLFWNEYNYQYKTLLIGDMKHEIMNYEDHSHDYR